VWSAGIVLLTVLCQRYPLLDSPDEASNLTELALFVGARPLAEYAASIGPWSLLAPLYLHRHTPRVQSQQHRLRDRYDAAWTSLLAWRAHRPGGLLPRSHRDALR